jgi:hypothetical protein
VASLLRFRHSKEQWTQGSVEARIYRPLDGNIGAEMSNPWFNPPDGFTARRFDMDNGDMALFAWTDDAGFWLGNTETPESLWRTDKVGFDEVPYELRRWAERELLAQLHEEDPWLADYPHLSWYFLPVFLSKDGRETSRRFFADHAGGFPVDDAEAGLSFYESFLETGVLDQYRHLMAGKLGTSTSLNLTRMTAAMAEFNAAYLLVESGYEIEPEAPVSTGHSIDFRATGPDGTFLIEVTRPAPPHRRNANSAVAALRRTASTKVEGQLDAHGGGVVLLVDCSGFRTEEWQDLLAAKPDVGHKPAVVYRLEPDGTAAAYRKGTVPLDLAAVSFE